MLKRPVNLTVSISQCQIGIIWHRWKCWKDLSNTSRSWEPSSISGKNGSLQKINCEVMFLQNQQFWFFGHKPTKVEPSVLEDISPGSENVPAIVHFNLIIFILLVMPHINISGQAPYQQHHHWHCHQCHSTMRSQTLGWGVKWKQVYKCLLYHLSQTLGCGVDMETNFETDPG